MKGRSGIKSMLLALLLSLSMVVTYLPVSMMAYATDESNTNDTIVEESINTDVEENDVDAEPAGEVEPADVIDNESVEEEGADALDVVDTEGNFEEPEPETLSAPEAKAASDGTTVLAFTSDVHNGTRQGSESNVSANRLDTWLSNVQPKYNNAIKVMGFCGDMAAAGSTYGANYWGFAETVMDRVSNKGMTGVYAVGNHEYANGQMGDSGSGREDIQGRYILNEEGLNAQNENYRIYCLGTNHGHGSSWAYEDSQITALTNYLNNASNDKVIIILTHFPLHDYGMHRTTNTQPVLDTLNTAALGSDGIYGTDDDKKIVFLWGHNHSEGDENYDYVWGPGDKLPNANNSTANFYYAAAGSMADTEYGQSGRVKGKGLVLTINNKKQLSFTYYDADGNNVTEGGTYTEEDPISATGVSIVEKNPSVDEGRKLQLHLNYTPADANANKGVVWSSSDTNIATVDQTGLVRGKEEGTTTITVTAADGSYSDSCVLTVNHNDNPSVEETISITPTSSNSPEQSISINKGDTLIVNVTNGSTSSAYDFTATLSKSGVATLDTASSVNITSGGTGQFTFTGIEDGKVDITIQNSNSYGSQYARKGVIHLTVGEGGTTPVDPPTGDSVSITPTTDNPEESIKIAVGDTLTINVTNGSSNSAYDFTASLSSSGIAKINGNATQNIAAGGTGTFTVEGLTDGTVDITIQNSNSYGSQYARKGVIHLTVGEGGTTPVDPPTGDSVSITPTTDNPEESIKIAVGDTLTINVTNGSSNSAYDFTASLSSSGIAKINGNATQNIAAGGTGTFIVEGLAEGTVDITIQNTNTYGSQYTRKGVIHLTVGEGGTTPVDPPTGDTVTYKLATALEDGKEYLIANGNSGSVYILSNEAGSSRQLKGVAATVTDSKITIAEEVAAKTAFTSEANSNSSQNGIWLKNGSQYLYADSNDGLRMVASSTQTSSSNNAKSWHYMADNKNLLWFFKDTSSSDGYTDTSSTYKYFLKVSSGVFTDDHATNTSLANTNTPVMYLFVKDEGTDPQPHTHSYGAPVWNWTGNDASGYTAATATFTCTAGDDTQTVNANVTDATSGNTTTYTAVAAFNGQNYTDTKTVTTPVDPPVGDTVTYKLATTLEAGKEYLIANGNSGSVYILSNEAGSSRQLKGVTATVTDSKITIAEEVAAKTAFTSEANSNSSQNGIWLKNGSQYLYADSNDGLRMVASSTQTSSSNNAKSWHYMADNKNLLWFFKDTSSSDGYTDTSSTYKYFLKVSSGVFTDDHATNTSLANTNTPVMYLFVKDEGTDPQPHTHTYGNPTWSWANDYTSATATFTCTAGDDTQTVTDNSPVETEVTAATCSANKVVKYTAKVTFNGEEYTNDSENVTIAGTTTDHTWGEWTVTTQPGCTTKGVETRTCSVCGTTETRDIAATGHTLTAHEATDATCDAAGNDAYWSCDKCRKFFRDRYGNSEIEENSWVIPAKGHKTTKTNAVPATCLEGGNNEYWTCSECGKFFSDANGNTEIQEDSWKTEALGHDFGEWEVTTPATETTEGVRTRNCSRCDATETEVIPMTAHVHQMTSVAAKDPTCEVEGNSAYWFCNRGDNPCHKYFSDAAGNTEIEMGSWIIPATGHKTVAHEAKTATCTEDGNSAYWSCENCDKFFSDAEGKTAIEEGSWVIKAGGHTYGAPEYTWSDDYSELEAKIVCTKCDEETDGHTITETVDVTSVTTDPTCVDPGSITYTSEEFEKEAFTKQTKTVTIDALGHDWSEWKEITAATETTKGTEKRTCSRCDAFETRDIPVLVHVHGLTKVNAKEATCTEEGNIEYWICDKGEHPCGRLYSDENGQTELDRSEVVISAKGHELTKTEAVGATCTEAGNSAYWTCAVCGKHFSDSEGKTEIAADSWVIKALGHDWGNWTVTKAATTTADGEETRKCSRCDEVETRAIKKLDPGSDPNKKGSDGTAVGPGASAASAAQAITNMAADTDLPGAAFGKLMLRSPKQGKNSITLNWAGVSGASKYVIYGNKCGKGNKPVKIAEVSGTTITRSNLAKGTYYKYIAVALDKNNMVVSTSKLIHVATKGGKVGNHKSVKVAKAVTKKAKALKVGKSLKLKAKAVPQSKKLKVKKHVAVRYESTNPSIATVSSKGTVKARSKGTCYVYAYAQNGVFKRIKITVK